MRCFCYALAAALLLIASASADSGFCDPEAWREAVDKSCSSGDRNATQQFILDASTCAFNQELRVFTQYASLNDTLQPRPGSVASSVQLVIGVSDLLNATEELHRDISSYYDGFVIEAEFLPEFAQAGVVAPLERAIITQPELGWYRVNRYYRAFSATDQGTAFGVPLSGSGAFLFYRRDLIQRANITVPATWEGLLAATQAWKAADPVPGVAPFCMSSRLQCMRTLLLSIAAPYLQTGGTREGFLIDPANGTLLFNTSGFTAALRTWQQLRGLARVENTSCSSGSDAFSAGSCLMTVQHFPKFKVYASNRSSVADDVGVALTPGSALVLNRTTGSLEPCTAASCPNAARVKTDASGAASGSLVNSAPFMWGGLVGVVSARNPWSLQQQLVLYLTDLTSGRSLENVLRENSRISPFRADHWSAASKREWTDAGYAEPAVTQMMAALQRLHSSPNLAPQLRLPGQADVRLALHAALADLVAGRAPEGVASGLQAGVELILRTRYSAVNGTAGYLAMYRQQLGYAESSAAAQAPPRDRGSGGVSRQTVVVIAVVVGLVTLLASVVVLEVRNKRRHKDLLGRVKPPLGDPDTTIVVASIQDFDELWEALISDASERALQQFSDLVDSLLRRHSGYRAPSDEEDVVAAFHNARDACEFARELQRGLLELRWPKHVQEMEQFRPQYLAQNKRATSFSQSYNGARTAAMSPLAGSLPAAEDDDKLFTLDTGTENVRSFGEQCVASWTPVEAADAAASPDSELVFCGIRARVGVCAVGYSQLALDVEPGHKRFSFVGEAVEVAAAAAAAAQGGMVLIPQSTFRQLHLELLAEQCLFCHLGEYQLTSELPPMDLYLALDRHLLGRLALFGPLACHMQWSQGAFAAPVHSASMVFTHVVGVQTLLAWDYDLVQDVIETFTKLAQVELQQAGGYLVEHVEGFMLTAFHSPADAILWGLRMQELMLKEDWPEELLAHELCEEVTVTVPVRGGEVTSATVFRGPRLKTGIDIGQVLARLHTMTGRMTYRGKVMNRAARISAAASSGQVLCSAEAWESCTASASALRLVTATSLGLFQLKGIQERIEVFHCTYQRHVPSSTRRSSTVSVGLVSSSDNRRKSAVVLSSMSHISHHTTSYRTSLHNSVALEQVSASDATGGRRGSHASSAALLLPGRGSLGGGQLSDMLHTVGADGVPSGSVGAGPLPAAAAAAMAAGTSAARFRAAPVPLLVGGGGGDCSAACASQTGSSHRSQGSSAAASALASRAALAAVLQSRTRSASAIHASSSTAPFRSASARSRRPAGLSGGAVASDPQVSLAVGAQPAKWNAGTATSPSATPSLAMATAAAAAAAQERVNSVTAANNASTNSPKAAATLDVPRSGTATANAFDVVAPTHSTLLGGLPGIGTGAHIDSPSTVAAAMYAVLPSVVLAGGVHAQPAAAAAVAAALAHGGGGSFAPHEARSGVGNVGVGGAAVAAAAAAGSRRLASRDGGVTVGASSDLDLESSPNDFQMATIATCVEDVAELGNRAVSHGGGGGGAAAAAGPSDPARDAAEADDAGTRLLAPPSAALHHQHHLQRLRQQQARHAGELSSPPLAALSPPFHFERVLPLDTLQEDSAPAAAEILCGGDMGMLDDGGDEGSRVETLEVTVSATGIVRGALSGAASSTGFGAALGSSHGASLSRCGSVTTGISYLALGLSGGLGLSSSPAAAAGATSAAGGAGSLVSSCNSSGFGHTSYTHGATAPPLRPQSAAVWRASMSMSMSASPQLHGLARASASAVAARRSGSANSADLFLPFPMAVTSGGGAGTAANSTSGSGLAAAASGGVSSPRAVGQDGSDDAPSGGAGGAPQRLNCEGVVAGAAAPPMVEPHRFLAPVHSTRLAAVAAAAAAEKAPAGRGAECAGAGTGADRQVAEVASSTTAAAAAAEPQASAVPPTGASRGESGAPVAAATAPAVARIVRVGAIACDASGSADASSSLVTASRSNSGNTAAEAAPAPAAAATAAAAAAAAAAPSAAISLPSAVRLGSGGRLRASNRTGSGTSNDLPSQAVSPCSTWASGGSGGSTTTTTIAAPGTTSVSPAVASGVVGLEQQPLLAHQQQLRALLSGVGGMAVAAAGDEPPAAAAAAAAKPKCGNGDCADQSRGGGAAGRPDSFARHRLRAVCTAGVGQTGGDDGDGGADADDEHGAAAAMAAAFGLPPLPPPPPPSSADPPQCKGGYDGAAAAAAAAAYGVGPPVGAYVGVGQDGSRGASGPTREQLALALELLGESRHATGSGWH